MCACVYSFGILSGEDPVGSDEWKVCILLYMYTCSCSLGGKIFIFIFFILSYFFKLLDLQNHRNIFILWKKIAFYKEWGHFLILNQCRMITYFWNKYLKKGFPLPAVKKNIQIIWPDWLFVFSNVNCSGSRWSFYIELKCESETPL